ncbi:hypothetical protein OC498_14410, partial [Acinetobacter bohemicus]|nr:hypothetical protein [Acinetobacter bohemicus]
ALAIGSGGSTGYYPFVFRNTPFTDPITGTVFPVSAYLKSAMMDYQSVKTSHIEDLAVNTAKIAKLAVKSGNIDDLAVTTLKIQDEAVTVPSSAEYPQEIIKTADRQTATYATNALISEWESYIGDVASITVNRSGGKLRIDCGLAVAANMQFLPPTGDSAPDLSKARMF